MKSEGMNLAAAWRDFAVSIADTPDKLEAAFRLRHQVYCVEREFEQGDGLLETDHFDGCAGHALLTQQSTGRIVGTVRIVVGTHGRSASLPMQHCCGSDLFRALPMGSTGEISRFSISRDLRDVGCASNAMLRLGLMQGIVRLSGQMGLTHWCALMEHTLLRLLRVSAIHFQALGPAVEHRGLRQPSWGAISTVLGRMRRERPAVWDYVTEGGSLWSEDEVAYVA